MNAAVASVVDWAVQATIWTATLYVVVRLADRLLEGRVAARARMALYLAIVVRLVLPAGWSGGIEVPATSRLATVAAGVSAAVADRAASSSASSDGGAWTSAWILGVYLVGVAALFTARVIAARRFARGARPARASLVALCPSVPVFESEHAGPAVGGVLRPRIVVPSRIVDTLDDDALAWIVRHEASHVAARDHWLLAGTQFLVTVLWPILPLWFAAARVRALMEAACDERTVAGSDSEVRRSYMRALSQFADGRSRSVRAAVSLGFANGVVERLRCLVGTQRRWPAFAQAGVVASLAAAAVACTSSREPVPMDDLRTDYLLVTVRTLPVEFDPPVSGGDPSVLHLVDTQLLSAAADGVIRVRSRGAMRMTSDGSSAAASPGMFFGDGLSLDGSVATLDTPTLIAKDHDEASVSIECPARSIVAGFTASAQPGESVDVDVHFEERVAGAVVRDLATTRVHLQKGDSVLIPTRRPTAVAR